MGLFVCRKRMASICSLATRRAYQPFRHVPAAALCTATSLRKTALFDVHSGMGGKMVDFAGWAMPLQYPEGTMTAHLHTRTKAGLFDVSHMLGVRITGSDRAKFMETVVGADIVNLPDGKCQLTCLTNDAGGIIDDCVVTNAGDHLYVVVNAGHEDK